MSKSLKSVSAFVVSLFLCIPVLGQDWLQWRGANRDGTIRDFKAPAAWPESLKLKWRVEVGGGFSSPLVAGDLEPDVDLRPGDLDGIPSDLDATSFRYAGLRTAYAIDRIAEEQTVRGQFVRDVRDSPDLSEDERRRVLVTGLRAIDGRTDLEVI